MCVADCGIGRIIKLSIAVSLDEIIRRWKSYTGIPYLRIALAPDKTPSDTLISSIAICVGSGASVLMGQKADLYFTGEMSHHEILKATMAHNATVILTEHTNCERGYLKDHLAARLHSELLNSGKDAMCQYEVMVSLGDRDPITII